MALKGFVPFVMLALMIVAPLLGAAGHPGHEPGEPSGWVETNDWTGFISCAVWTPTQPVYPCQPYDAHEDKIHAFTVGEDLKTLVVGMEWDSSLLQADQLRIRLEEYGIEETGSSPIEFRLDEGEDFDPITDPQDLTFEVLAPWELSVIYQQPFTVYYHEFYGEHAPEGYSALPDH